MPRTSQIHYIAPSAISIIPNANASFNDIAVYIAEKASLMVYSPKAGIRTDKSGNFQWWYIKGRNRRLAEGDKKYTIYARLVKNSNIGYIVFAPMEEQDGVWTDKYAYITIDGYSAGQRTNGYYYIRLGEVSLPEDGKRTVELDTGILGTDQFNNEWALNPDAVPLRLEFSCTIDDEDAGPTPYVYWGQTLQLSAMLTEGWTGTDIQRFDHWEITRDTGDEVLDAAWNANIRSSSFPQTGSLSLRHGRGTGETDDFQGAVNTTFTVCAMERTDDPEEGGTPQYAVLKEASICVMAETWEKYELSPSTSMVTYNPQTRAYSPSNGVRFYVRATDQKNDVFLMTKGQLSTTGIVAEYAAIDSSSWTAVTFTGPDTNFAEGAIPASVFTAQKSINVRLRNAANQELHRFTIAFLRDGEDSKEREWIFLRSATEITFGTQQHPYPASINGGQVDPTGAATGSDTNKNQDGWVPEGWWDEEQGVDATNAYEYGAYRNYDHDNNQWGAFTTPKIWHHYGKDGNSITKVSETHYYIKNTTGTRPAADDPNWNTTKPTVNKGEWLFTKVVITWSDNSTTVLYTDERNPNDGVAGQDIIVDGATVMKYYVGDSNTTHPAEDSNEWKDLSQLTQTQGKWLWSKATTWYRKSDSAADAHDAGHSVNYNVSYISKDGAEGRGITSVAEYYKASANATGETAPSDDSGWSTDPNVAMQSWGETNKYLWNYEKVTYSKGTTVERTTPQVLAIWTKDGAAGKGIDSITNYYKVTNSLTPPSRTDSGWDDDPVAPNASNPYLWNYEEINWLNPTGKTYTAVQMIGHYGKDGISVKAQYSANGTSWHDAFTTGDVWMRTSTDNGTTWSTAMKIVGENGSETDFSFGISQYKTTDNAQTAPSDISSWSDAPIATTTNKPYLWAKVQYKNGDGSVVSTSYIRFTGEDGKSITKSSETYKYATNNTGVRPAVGSADWSTTKPTLEKGYWLYTETTITWSDNSKTVLYTDERNPNDGQPGMDIVAGTTTIQYKLTETNVQPTSGWGSYPEVLTQGWYLWSKSTTPYYKDHVGGTSAGESVSYNVSYIAEDGLTGRGISSTSEHYKASTLDGSDAQHSEAAPAGTEQDPDWTTNPNVPDGQGNTQWNETNKYLWNYEKITYTNSDGATTIERTTPRRIAIWTKNGKGIDSITNYYKVQSAKPDLPADIDTATPTLTGWSINSSTPPAGQFLWNFERIVWIESDGTNSYTHSAVHSSGYTGTNGTSVSIKGRAQTTNILDPDWQTNVLQGIVLLFNDSDDYAEWDEEDEEWEYYSANIGDCYIVNEDKHLYEMQSDGWHDLGRFEGEKGNKGDNVIRLALDNQHEDFQYDDAGNNRTGNVTSAIHLYDGNTEVLSGFTVSPVLNDNTKTYGVPTSGTDAPYVSGGVLTVKALTANAAKVTIKTTYKGADYYAEFTANKTNQDKYELIIKPNAISYNSSAYSEQTITIGAKRTDIQGHTTPLGYGTGNDNISNVADSGLLRLFVTNIRRQYDSPEYVEVTEQMLSGTYSVTSERANYNYQKGLYFELRKYDDSNYTVVDYETVEIAMVQNGVNVLCSPAAIIVNQSLDDPTNLNTLSEVVTFTIMKGTTPITPYKIEATPERDGQNYAHCQVSGSNSNTATLTKIETYKQGGKDYYYDRTYFTAKVYYNDGGTNKSIDGIKINIAANLIGTWKEKIEGDTKQAIAESTWFALDANGNIVESDRLGTFEQSSKKALSRLDEQTYVTVKSDPDASFRIETAGDYRIVLDMDRMSGVSYTDDETTITLKRGSTTVKTYSNQKYYDRLEDTLPLTVGTYTITASPQVTIVNLAVYSATNTKYSELNQTVNQIGLTVYDANTGISALNVKADSVTSEVTALKSGKNILSGVLTGNGWKSCASLPTSSSTPTYHNITVDANGNLIRATGDTYLVSPTFHLKQGEQYTLSFTGGGSFMVYVKNVSSGNVTDILSNHMEGGGRLSTNFTSSGDYNVARAFFGINISEPQIETGSEATAFEAGDTEMSSKIKQTADEIDMSITNKLGETGININGNTKTINLIADKVKFKNSAGTVDDKIWIDSTEGTLHAENANINGRFEGSKGRIVISDTQNVQGEMAQLYMKDKTTVNGTEKEISTAGIVSSKVGNSGSYRYQANLNLHGYPTNSDTPSGYIEMVAGDGGSYGQAEILLGDNVSNKYVTIDGDKGKVEVSDKFAVDGENGLTRSITIGGVTLRFVGGILVEVT